MATPDTPLPRVGDLITKDFGPDNINTWSQPGLVRSIVDDHIIVKREHDRGWYLQIITPEEWKYGHEVFRIVPQEAVTC